MTNAIEVHELRKAFGDVRALDGASLTVPAGSVYGLVGPNASGKTTLLSIVRGVVRPTSGEALVFGRPPLDDPAVKGRIALASGNPYFLKPESADGMARFYRSVLPIFDVDRYLELAPLFEVDRTRPLRKLSRGARAKAALLLALSCTADLLLLDEAMDLVDPIARKRMWSVVLDQVSSRGLTVVAATHNLRELEGVCDHLAILDRGVVRDEADLNEPASDIVKVQVMLPEGAELPTGLEVVHARPEGRLLTLLVRGNAGGVREELDAVHPTYLDIVPLSLEERFVCELGGDDHEA
ncbi:ATP-binding cassette domain-containing protein [Parafannyhessea umbonata]|uniref:ABC transporter ATP-binding protein n=1 Tax=Parafannyhessea umbonata TaxID=604330 RepID=A0A7X9Y100_9ACTN|nr:ABC transporter ATP-binding protein [Parafannyhessea umbonata]MDD7199409.1 ABC transporter ATP-binding protein [Parafannyhessea umbonata]MDY4419185.1 ABC transporter ATP-binding protein [Parafannyhessea umbonata]NMF26309.1 ABC transporter ATP-binding protein [Parafannyhessea umbonata]